MNTIKKVAVTGPESTGKSFLCSELAAHYNTAFVPEYARAYLDKLGRDYIEDDILEIARGQLDKEQKMAAGLLARPIRPLLFCDTEFIVAKIWSLHKYNRCHPWILEQIQENTYDLYLLCDIDLPWEPDPQREHPHLRRYFFDWYLKELQSYGFKYAIIRGHNQERVKNGIEVVNNFYVN